MGNTYGDTNNNSSREGSFRRPLLDEFDADTGRSFADNTTGVSGTGVSGTGVMSPVALEKEKVVNEVYGNKHNHAVLWTSPLRYCVINIYYLNMDKGHVKDLTKL